MSKLSKHVRKLEVYASYLDGSFDRKDRSRLKPMVRLRKSEEEIEQEKNGDIKLRVRDWYCDIDRGYSK